MLLSSLASVCQSIPGGPKKKPEQSIQSIFQDFALINSYLCSPCWIQHLYLIIITPRSSNLVENVLFYEQFFMYCNFRDLPDFQSSEARLMTASAAHAPTHTSIQTATKISVPMTCLDCKSLLGNVVCRSMGNTRITEHNTRSIYGRPKLSLIVPQNSGNRANPENDSP